jgi:hypothetical protein
MKTSIADILAKKDAENKRLRAENEQVKNLVCKLQLASGCSCCRDCDAWYAAKDALAEIFGLPRYNDDSGYDWSPLEQALEAKDAND